ncbi:MAG TPA: hypothetical protein ENN55_03980 [Firmicutes bacterium]|nr:hypothetical protein [Bacillota bacterium]
MTLENCGNCGKVFDSDKGEKLCADCIINEKKELLKVTNYLKKNPLAGIMDVTRDTGVSRNLVFRMINSGSLQIRKTPDLHKCRFCGKGIKYGSVCASCREKIEGMGKK